MELEVLYQKCCGLFNEEEITATKDQFDALANNGKINREHFSLCLTKMFEYPEKASTILQNPLFIDRVFAFMTSSFSADPSSKLLSWPEFITGTANTFSSENEDQLAFRFFVYDLSGIGSFGLEDVKAIVTPFLNIMLEGIEKEKRAQQEADLLDAPVVAIEDFKGHLGEQTILSVIKDLFTKAGVDKIDKKKFFELADADSSLFDWAEIADTVLELFEQSIEKKD
eukprot:TRINITY_DN8859_c0_g1_i1.p2 TRINITY_DN8859_c0_g1~~TRINITY_DN8859_c0_g1_i1.p2  ORF type:complete len:226 (+),score=48.52 TRINITY_DN8859_c0_g1_i1:24-701(+)